ncbi:MAG: F0F1 ATP synthase subunit B [Verrucomicrobia bacterium]|nr:F0F1 ATP synthase subunit B [Verrucomicrobiota bacterium]
MTLPLFLAAAAEQASTSGPIEGLRQTFEHFGVEPKFIAFQAISFLIVLVVLYKFGIKPTIATMEERAVKIGAGLKYAEEMQAKLAAAQQESAAIVKKSQVEATRIIEDARKSAKDFTDKQTQEASARANDILTKAQQAIELEHKKMLADARTEIARLVVSTTERVLAKKLTDADRASYNEAATRELTSV